LPEKYSFLGQGIDVWGLHGSGVVEVVAFDVLPSQVVGQEEHDVWFCRSTREEEAAGDEEKRKNGRSS